jgi:hypothetical protein
MLKRQRMSHVSWELYFDRVSQARKIISQYSAMAYELQQIGIRFQKRRE